MLPRSFHRYCLHAPANRKHAVFFSESEPADLTRPPGVRAAAEFSRKVTDFDYTYPVPVFFTEKRDRLVLVEGDINRDILDGFNFLVAQDFLVDEVFDILKLLIFHSGEVREVKTQMIGCNQRSRLLD